MKYDYQYVSYLKKLRNHAHGQFKKTFAYKRRKAWIDFLIFLLPKPVQKWSVVHRYIHFKQVALRDLVDQYCLNFMKPYLRK
jgi:hypothetical protein